MKKKYKDKIIENYTSNIIQIEENNINSIELGFIKDNCSTNIFYILIECVKNMYIFNNTQSNNILNMINKISLYG